MLVDYPNKEDAAFLSDGFSLGFKLQFEGPRIPIECKNLKSVVDNPEIAEEKIKQEVNLGRIAGPFSKRPISNMRCSPIGLVEKKSGGYRLITHLSHPPGLSVNEHINDSFASVKYSNFDNAVSIIKSLGKGCLIATMDVKSAFRLLPCYPGDFDLLGFKLGHSYFIDKMAPMGLRISCRAWEAFATFLNWLVADRFSKNVDHYLDDFFFAGPHQSTDCASLMAHFQEICKDLGVPIAAEKTQGPTTCLTYLGYELDTVEMLLRIPDEKVKQILEKVTEALERRKLTLKELQSLTGSLSFCAKAMPSARAFIRRMYAAMSKAKQPHHRVRLTRGIKEDLEMWQTFLIQFNGLSYMLDLQWTSSATLGLQTDSAGGAALGCGAYFQGDWVFLKWPLDWEKTGILLDITFLEMVPIALAVCLWKDRFVTKRILFASDNMAVVHILNSKSAKSERVMSLVRQIVLWSLQYDFIINSSHVKGCENQLSDAISRMQWAKFKALAPEAKPCSAEIPREFWRLLPEK
ncbi:MAG: hypothetical protein KUF82_20545 [Candidatus Thiodiazotropha sp. (ex Ctena orbiculata)]|nr:hypothetical protein [Candidatus Thiodiazotropha taylori]